MLWAKPSNITNLATWGCFKSEELYKHSEHEDSRQQTFPKHLLLQTELQQHYMLAKQLLNPPNAPASLTSINSHRRILLLPPPPSHGELLEPPALEQDAEALGSPHKILTCRE